MDTSIEPQPPVYSGLERHIQSVLLAIAIAILGWLGLTVQSSATSIATLSEKVSQLENRLREDRGNIYTVDMANRDMANRDMVFKALESRVSLLER